MNASHHTYQMLLKISVLKELVLGEQINTFEPNKQWKEIVLHCLTTKYSNFASGTGSASYMSTILSVLERLVIPVSSNISLKLWQIVEMFSWIVASNQYMIYINICEVKSVQYVVFKSLKSLSCVSDTKGIQWIRIIQKE